MGYVYRRTGIRKRWSSLYGVNGGRRLRAALRKLREGGVKKDLKHKTVKVVVEISFKKVSIREVFPYLLRHVSPIIFPF
ncbi:hypothetical protein IOK49_04045 [Fervidicoccus fontis]|uniref:Uncharacterized protein n=1 Tax=Fervidicoccus fontis TaxID=683846 RepID=A0A843A979_9CREN|nr:hypothetical protein [Fervidicoccus fontis]MBE9391245.1 hypothetical protein [Fervidicoccus fontis]